MEHRQPFRNVVDSLPHRVGATLKLEVSESSLQVNVAPSRRYVWPDLLVSTETIDSPIILISAPGAMGKSMAARAVASALDAPFVDLSSLSVGSDTLTGLLARVLGWTQTPDLIKDLRFGRSTLVLDGLDEAQLRAGREHTVAFLQNIVELVKDAEASVGQIVIFGRRDAVETSYLVFSEQGISPFMATIAPLTRPQANELVDLELDHKVAFGRKYDVHRVHPTPFAQLRDRLFKDIAEALGATASSDEDYWESVGDFLGYPPVLLVFAERLAVENPSADLSDMRMRPGGATRIQHGDLLRKIVEGILDRESSKVRQQLSQALSLSPDDSRCEVLYAREEQLLRVLNYSSEYLNLDLLPPAVLSNGERRVYEEQISTFVPDHPFLRDRKFANVVFGDYVRSFIAVGQQIGAYGRPKAEVLQACPVVGPFFADLVYSFLSEQSPDSAPPESRAILSGEDLIDDLIMSYYSGRIGGEAFFVYTHSPDNNAYLALYEAESVAEESRSREPYGLFFRITNPSGVLELTTPLLRGIVVSNHGLVLKSLSDEVEIGPDFMTVVSELEIVGRRLTALGGHAGGEIGESVLVARQAAEHDPALSVSSYPSTALQVVWPSPWHMWRPYVAKEATYADSASTALPGPARWQVMIGVRRILTSFRGTINNPSVNRDRLDRYGTGSNPVFVAVLNGLIELGIVQRDGPTYRLQLGTLDEYGVNYSAVRGADFSETLSKLTAKLCSMTVVRTSLQDS